MVFNYARVIEKLEYYANLFRFKLTLIALKIQT